jgi:hypothetical protein
MEQKAHQREKAQKEKERRKQEAEVLKEKRAEERILKTIAKVQRRLDAEARRAFNQKWSPAAVARVGNDLHRLIKSGVPPPPRSYTGKFLCFIPRICRENQAIAMARRKARMEGYHVDKALRTTPPPWVHRANPRFCIELPSDSDAATEA